MRDIASSVTSILKTQPLKVVSQNDEIEIRVVHRALGEDRHKYSGRIIPRQPDRSTSWTGIEDAQTALVGSYRARKTNLPDDQAVTKMERKLHKLKLLSSHRGHTDLNTSILCVTSLL